MANQLFAAQMIPRLGVTGLASAPPGRLPSHLDLLRLLLHQQHYDLVGFQGMGKICCKVDGKTHKARLRSSMRKRQRISLKGLSLQKTELLKRFHCRRRFRRHINFLSNFKCLKGPPRLVFLGSPFGYGVARYPAVTCWVGNFFVVAKCHM